MTSLAFQDPALHPLDEALVGWMLGPAELDGDEPVAAHLFECGRCTGRIEQLRTVVGALADLQRHAHRPIQTRASLAALEQRGERLQHLHGRNGGEVTSPISGEADIIILHLPVAGADDAPLVVSLCAPHGQAFIEFPAERAEAGEVLLACHRFVAQGTPTLRVMVSRRPDGAVLCDALFSQPPL
jgi:hypothetical protein